MEKQEPCSRRLRIAFAHIAGAGWTAGTYYLKNIFIALHSIPSGRRPEIILLVQQKVAEEEYQELAPYIDEVLHRPTCIRNSAAVELANNLGKKIGFGLFRDNPLSVFLKRQGVDIFFTRGVPAPNFLLPFLSWIPDFQHIHYPAFFSAKEKEVRNVAYAQSAQDATRVVLSSRSALKDFENFAPWAGHKARVLSFVAQVPERTGYPLRELCSKYQLPEKFILLPNQFWKHKNHETVIHALSIALRERPDLTIVCTGGTHEYRDAEYFSRLLCLISSSGVRERMILLGLVPRNDLFCLMRQAMAVLQPSLFEGWNTAVEEAKSLGKRVIVSDIPVHREQDPSGAIYFDPADSWSLAQSLLEVYANSPSGLDLELERVASESLKERTRQYGERFLEVACEAITSYS